MARTFLSAIKETKGPLLGCVVTLPATLAGQVVARSDMDFVMIDMEHSPYTAQQATQLVPSISAASAGRCVPIVRIPSHGVEWVKWALDSGAAGIIIPMVNTAEEMEGIIKRGVYPPRGQRSYGPFNAPYANPDPKSTMASYFANSKDVCIMPIIESKEGVENAEAILGVDGVAGCFIGPFDLRLSLGVPGGIDGPEPVFNDALQKVLSIGKKLGKPIGSMGIGEEVARKRTEIGMDFLLVSIDAAALGAGLNSDYQTAAKGAKSAL